MIELKEILKVLKQNLTFILVVTVIGGLAGFAYSKVKTEKFEAQNTLYVKREADTKASAYYSYDGFYAQQVSKEYTDTVLGLLKTIEPYRDAVDKTTASMNPRLLMGNTKVRKVSPQIISVSVTNVNEETAKDSLKALVAGLADKVKALNQGGDKKIQVEPVRTEPITTLDKTSQLLNLSIGFLAGLIISILSLALGIYLNLLRKTL